MLTIFQIQKFATVISIFVYWFSVYGVSNLYLIPKKKFDYIKKPISMGIYFLISSILPLVFIYKTFPQNLLSLAMTSSSLVIVTVLIYAYNKRSGFAQLLISKGMDVTFQQLTVLLLVNRLSELNYLSIPQFALLFLSLHIPVFFLKRIKNLTKLILFIGISFGGFIFAYIYLNFFVLSLGINQLIHMSFYIVYWTFFRKNTNMGIVTYEY